MKARCRTCASQDRAQIDAALVAGESPVALAARYGIPRQTIERHRASGHAGGEKPTAARTSSGKTATARAKWLAKELEALLRTAVKEGLRDVPDLSREYRQVLSMARIWEREEASERAAEHAKETVRALDQPGVSDLLDRLLASLSGDARAEVIEWLQQERNATDPN